MRLLSFAFIALNHRECLPLMNEVGSAILVGSLQVEPEIGRIGRRMSGPGHTLSDVDSDTPSEGSAVNINTT